MSAPLDDAIAKLRGITRGPKGNRPDYVGTLTTEQATLLLAFIDRAKPLYDAHAFGDEELRYLHAYRALSAEGRRQLESFAAHLATRYAAVRSLDGTEKTGDDV